MGEVAEMILDGTLCQSCGVFIGEGEGFPRECAYCRRAGKAAGKIACPVCKKKVKGLNDHIRDAHPGHAEREKAAHETATRDMLDSARSDLDLIREALGVPAEPHQSLLERMVEAAQAKRGVVPEGWRDAVQKLENLPSFLAGWKLSESCIRNDMGTEVSRWIDGLSELYKLYAAPAPDQFRDAAKMMAEPAEVPIPEPVAYGFGNTAITGHTNRLMMVRLDVPLDDQYAGAYWLPLVLADEALTYGAACRAAGEAAGYARGLAEGAARTGLTPAEHDVLAERQRQISAEGWTPEHDDEHRAGDLPMAAACYAAHAGTSLKTLEYSAAQSFVRQCWPWSPGWWKPTAPRRDLVKAAALLLAEIERLDRAAPAEVPKPAKCDGNHGGPRCADPECWNDPVDDVIDVRMAAKRLVKRALAVGVVLTIETQPRQPLAMGNYDLVVETREARKGGAA